MKRKKLLVDAHTFDENHQGIRTFLKGIYNAIEYEPEELEIILVANNIENLKQEFKDQQHFKYVQLKYTNKYIRLAYEIPKLVKQLKIDFAHFNYYLPLFLNSKCKYIVTIHDVLFIDYPHFFPLKYRIVNTFMFGRSARKGHIVNTVSNYSKNRIKHHFNIKKKPITVIPNAVSRFYCEYTGSKNDKLYIKKKYKLENYIVFVSRLEPRKNHKTLIQAYVELELWKKNYSLLLIGKETFHNEELALQIENANLLSNGMIFRLEDISNEELAMIYNGASLSIFPSICEGFGIPPIESAILKTPTLCSNETAMSDFDFFNDYLFNPYDKEELKNKIVKVLEEENSSETKEKLTEISNTIKAKYNWENSAEKLKSSILEFF